jgi:hypothetical protein
LTGANSASGTESGASSVCITGVISKNWVNFLLYQS